MNSPFWIVLRSRTLFLAHLGQAVWVLQRDPCVPVALRGVEVAEPGPGPLPAARPPAGNPSESAVSPAPQASPTSR